MERSPYQWLVFHLYDLKSGTFEETFWRPWDSTEALVQEWKDKGHRLVLEGYVVLSYRRHIFVPAGEMQRIWSLAMSSSSIAWTPNTGTRLFIWETGDAPAGDDIAPDEAPS